MDPQTLHNLGVALILAGISVIVVAVMLLFVSSIKGKARVKGGGAIFIGPFPIVFGTDKESMKTVMLLSITLLIIAIIFTAIFYRFFR